jgi:hypothetical protein
MSIQVDSKQKQGRIRYLADGLGAAGAMTMQLIIEIAVSSGMILYDDLVGSLVWRASSKVLFLRKSFM